MKVDSKPCGDSTKSVGTSGVIGRQLGKQEQVKCGVYCLIVYLRMVEMPDLSTLATNY